MDYTPQENENGTWDVLIRDPETNQFQEPETGFVTKSEAVGWVLMQRFPETAGRRAKPTA